MSRRSGGRGASHREDDACGDGRRTAEEVWVRTKEPWGMRHLHDNPRWLERTERDNLQLLWLQDMCIAVADAGGDFAIENPLLPRDEDHFPNHINFFEHPVALAVMNATGAIMKESCTSNMVHQFEPLKLGTFHGVYDWISTNLVFWGITELYSASLCLLHFQATCSLKKRLTMSRSGYVQQSRLNVASEKK